MTAAPPAPPASSEWVKGLLAGGHTLTDVSAHTGWPRPRLTALITEWKGWLFDHERDIAYQPGKPAKAPAAPLKPRPAPEPRFRPDTATVAELITRAADMDDKAVQRELTRVTGAVARLRTAVAEAGERKAALERVATLERALAAAKARAKELGAKHTAPKPGRLNNTVLATGATSKQIRAWAEDNGVECNAHGKPRQDVVDAYNAAHGGG